MRKALASLNLWDDAKEEALLGELRGELEAAVKKADSAPDPKPWDIVEHVFAEMTPDQQRAWEALHDQR